MKRLKALGMALAVLLFLLPHPGFAQKAGHEPIVLKGYDGKDLDRESKEPYSPRKTCGLCHDYDRISNGYHFQQGRTDGSGKIVMGDAFNPKAPWNLSAGMFGKHSPAEPDSSQLAPKRNDSSSRIDRSAFSFVQRCGACHPGGGFGESDRRGKPYYDEGSKKFGHELTDDDPRLDGDYTAFSGGDPNHGAPWDRSGPSEADCLLCHLKGYLWKDRAAALREKVFKYGPSVGAGWATLPARGEPDKDKGTPLEITVDYSLKEVADIDTLNEQIVKSPPDEACWSCHAVSEGRKRGRQWGPENDRHKAGGLNCVYCHPGNLDHNFAKGNPLQETVREDLNGTMRSCEDCHVRGKDRKAPRRSHPFSPRHMRRIACLTCHIPYQTVSAELVVDHASTGTTVVYDTSRFLSSNPLDPGKPLSGLDQATWVPGLREWKGKIVPVKPLAVIAWSDFDEKTNTVRPIPLWKVRDLAKPALRDDNGDGIPEVNTHEEIKAFLHALKGKDKFGTPVAANPVLLKGGFLYRLDKKGEAERVKHDQAQPLDFSISHNVVSGTAVIGSRGCRDCHSRNSSFFLRKILVDPFDEKGKPVYVEAWERLGIPKERLERLLMEQY